jgi:hypothetical protein
LRPQFGAPVADGFCAGLPQVASRSNADQPAAGFFRCTDSTDRVAAYQRYFEAHRRILEPYWHNYVVDPDGPTSATSFVPPRSADRTDLREMLERTDVVALARSTEQRCGRLLEQDTDVQVVLMVGVGAANAGELVVEGTGSPSRASSISPPSPTLIPRGSVSIRSCFRSGWPMSSLMPFATPRPPAAARCAR